MIWIPVLFYLLGSFLVYGFMVGLVNSTNEAFQVPSDNFDLLTMWVVTILVSSYSFLGFITFYLLRWINKPLLKNPDNWDFGLLIRVKS